MRFYASIAGVAAGILFNRQTSVGIGSAWWHGVVFAIAMYPLIILIVKASALAAVGASNGLVVGGNIAVIIAIVSKDWSYLPGAILTSFVALVLFTSMKQVLGSVVSRNR